MQTIVYVKRFKIDFWEDSLEIGIILGAIWNQRDDQDFLHSRIKEDFSGLENGGTNFKRGLTSVKADSSKTIIGERRGTVCMFQTTSEELKSWDKNVCELRRIWVFFR